MHSTFIDTPALSSLGLQIGPLNYRLVAHDDWGQRVLDGIAGHLAVAATLDRIDRTIHLMADDVEDRAAPPEAFAAAAALQDGPGHWQQRHTRFGRVWTTQVATGLALWTSGANSDRVRLRFDFPWWLLFNDLRARGGGVMHAGLAHHDGAGLLFLAPPGGGKSTLISTVPRGWQAYSDDAALVWPDPEQGWQASPLPAWGAMLQPREPWRYAGLDCSARCHLKGLVLLEKSAQVMLERIAETVAMPAVYRSMCEYPAAILAEDTRPESTFRMASAMARALIGWWLNLPRMADVWPLLAREAA